LPVLASFFKFPSFTGVFALARSRSIDRSIDRSFKLPAFPGVLVLPGLNPILGFRLLPSPFALLRSRSILDFTSLEPFPEPFYAIPGLLHFLETISLWPRLLSHGFQPLSGRRRYSDRAFIPADLMSLPVRTYPLSMRRVRISHLRKFLPLFLRVRSMPKIHFYYLLSGRLRFLRF
jgi:hypothetical protein